MSYTKKNYAIHPRTEVRFSPLSTKQLSDLDFWLIILKIKANRANGRGGVFEKTKMQKATFGAGCFWRPEEIFSKVKGVISTTVGYMGGEIENPTYEQVCGGKTGHAEVVQVEVDPA